MKPITLLRRINKHIKEINILGGDSSAYKIIGARIENNVKTYKSTNNNKIKEIIEKEMDNYRQVLPELYGRKREENNAVKLLKEEEMEYLTDFIAEHNLAKSPKRLQEIFEEINIYGYTYADYKQYRMAKQDNLNNVVQEPVVEDLDKKQQKIIDKFTKQFKKLK